MIYMAAGEPAAGFSRRPSIAKGNAMTEKGICDKCGAKAKIFYCEKCEKSFCKKCLKKTMSGSKKCPFCEGYLD